MPTKELKTGTLHRSFVMDRSAVDEKARTVELAFSSEEPYPRWFGIEVLDHSPAAVRLDRMKQNGPLLVDHDTRDHVGVVEDIKIDSDKTGRAVVRFGQSPRAQEIFQDVLDGIRGNVSVGYQIHRMILEDPSAEDEVYRAVDWEPLEISLVSVPADTTVGVGRSAEGEHKTIIEHTETPGAPKDTPEQPIEEKKNMPENIEVKDVEKQPEQKRDLQAEAVKILEIADQHDAHQLASEHLRKGSSVEEFVCALLERSGATKAPETPEIGMSKKEVDDYSLYRAVQAHIDRDWSRAGLEREVSLAVAEKSRRQARGFFIPHDVLNRDITTGGTGAGLVGTDHIAGSFIDLLRNKAMVMQLGAKMLDGLVGDVAIPKQTGGATTYWIDNEAGDTTESGGAYGTVSLSPKTVSARVDISRKQLLQSAPSVEALTRSDLAAALALAIDQAAINGDGSGGAPTGILNTTGIGGVVGGTNGLAPTWAHMVALWREVAKDNAAFGSLAFLTNSDVIGKLMTTDKGTDTGQFVVTAFPDSNGMTNLAGGRCAVSEQVPNDLDKGTSVGVCSAAIYGNFADLLIGSWSGLDIKVDEVTLGDRAGLVIRAFQDVDIAVRHAESFSAMSDILTA